MRRNIPAHFLFGLVLLAWLHAGDSHAASSAGLLTANEQGLLLQTTGMNGENAASSQNQFLSDLEKTIRRANSGMDSESLRRPVSEAALRELQVRSALLGNLMSQQELWAASDYAHTLLRESPGQSLIEKVKKLPMQQNKAIHGSVAELAEARSRGMVLTKSRTSTTYDLTEERFQPRNYQMKIYAQPSRALSELLKDFQNKSDYIKSGIFTQDTLDRLVKSGRIVRDGNVYRPVGRPDIEIEPSDIFSRPGESSLYAKTGRESLINQGLNPEETTLTRIQTAGEWFQTGNEWLGRLGIVGISAYEIYTIQGAVSGRLSKREFVTTQSAIVGGAGGAWAGAEIGSGIGTLLVGGPEDPLVVIAAPAGALVGGIVGAIVGGKAGENIATGIYGRLDEKQRQDVEAFIYQHYDVSR
jgi:hypothetical protein